MQVTCGKMANSDEGELSSLLSILKDPVGGSNSRHQNAKDDNYTKLLLVTHFTMPPQKEVSSVCSMKEKVISKQAYKKNSVTRQNSMNMVDSH